MATNIFGAKIPTNASLSTSTPVARIANTPVSSPATTAFMSGGRSSQKKGVTTSNASASITKAQTVTPSPTSSPHTQGGWQNVADTGKLIFMKTANIFGANYDLSPKGSPSGNDYLTNVLTDPRFILGAPAAVAAVAPIFATGTAAAGTTAAATGTGLFGKGAAAIGGLGTTLAAAGVGVIAGASLFGEKTQQTAAQTTNPTQATSGAIDTTQRGGEQSGGDIRIGQEGQGNSLLFQSDRYQIQQTYNYASPSQSISPTQSVEPSQSQEATAGTNWGLLALVGVGAYLLANR